MTDKTPEERADPRKERLAAQLRLNLRRRKAQGRALGEAAQEQDEGQPDS